MDMLGDKSLTARVSRRAHAHGWPIVETVRYLLRVGLRWDPIMAGRKAAAGLSKAQRHERASLAARARWKTR